MITWMDDVLKLPAKQFVCYECIGYIHWVRSDNSGTTFALLTTVRKFNDISVVLKQLHLVNGSRDTVT